MLSDVIYPELKTTGKLLFSLDNYLIWKPKILFVLADYGLDDDVLTTSDSTDPQRLKSARFHILLSLDDLLLSDYAKHSTTKSIMDSLEDRFNFCRFSKQTNLLRVYCDHKMQQNVRINEHIFRMRAMAKELEIAGLSVPEQMQAVTLLNSVPEDWRADVESVRLGSNGREEELSVDNAILRLRIANDCRKWKNYVNNYRPKKGFKITCNNCGKKGHRKPDCPEEEASRAQGGFLFVGQDQNTSYTGIFYPQLKTSHRLDSSGSSFSRWEHTLSDMFGDNKVNYVLTDPKPPVEDVNRHKKWLSDDLLCRHLMLGAMDNDLFLTFHGYPSAKALMDAIKAFFTFSSNARRMLLTKKYMDCRMSEGTSITDHTNKMENLAWKLKRAGVDIPDEMRTVSLMNSLPGSWNDTLTSLKIDIDLKKKAVDFDTVRRRLWDAGYIIDAIARENETEISSKKFKKSRKVVKGNCFSCGMQGHYASNCPNTG